MPIYEYRCTGCGHTLETIQKIDDRPLKKCPECSGKLEKLVSRAAFLLKGGGWYSEGYGRSSSSEPTSGSSSESSSDKPSGDSGSKETKKETKKAAAGGCGSGSCGCH